MNKEDIIYQIATSAYNAGFGAKKSFASLDMATKGPNVIGWLLMTVGIVGLVNKWIASEYVSAATLCIGALTYYLSVQRRDLKKWEASGVKLTQIRDELGILCAEVKATKPDMDLTSYTTRLQSLQSSIAETSVTQQMNFSGWFAHFKFFGEAQIKWIDDELKFKLFRDKIPASLYLFIACLLLVSVLIRILTY